MWSEERKAEFFKINEIVKAGYGGTLQNGNIVDRREHPEAIPLQKNTLLDCPEPKEVDELTREAIKDRPPFVRIET
jgi:hypothetical protein